MTLTPRALGLSLSAAILFTVALPAAAGDVAGNSGKTSEAGLPERNIVGAEPGMFKRNSGDSGIRPVPMDNSVILVLERMELLEKKLSLLEARMSQLQKGGK